MGRAKSRLTRAGIVQLQGYYWPGNICELRNVIERAVILECGSRAALHPRKNPEPAAPGKRIEGLQKSFPESGETQTISIPLKQTTFDYYDDGKKSWVADNDSFEILIGSSSRDLRLRAIFSNWRKNRNDSSNLIL